MSVKGELVQTRNPKLNLYINIYITKVQGRRWAVAIPMILLHIIIINDMEWSTNKDSGGGEWCLCPTKIPSGFCLLMSSHFFLLPDFPSFAFNFTFSFMWCDY